MMSRPKLTLFVMLVAAALLNGCGIRPGKLIPPAGEKNDNFPRVYPHDPNHPDRKDNR